jgi:hypothetical protein
MYPFLLGFISNLYDDIEDLHINIKPEILEILKSSIILLTTLLCYNDFWFSVTLFLALLVSYITGSIDTPFWMSYFAISIPLMFISFQPLTNILFSISIISIYAFGCFIDLSYFFVEETSFLKFLFRLLYLIMFCILKYITTYDSVKLFIGDSVFIDKLITNTIGYLLSSVCVQAYTLNDSKTILLAK